MIKSAVVGTLLSFALPVHPSIVHEQQDIVAWEFSAPIPAATGKGFT